MFVNTGWIAEATIKNGKRDGFEAMIEEAPL